MSTQTDNEVRLIPDSLKRLSNLYLLCGVLSIAVAVFFMGNELWAPLHPGDLLFTAWLAAGIAAGLFLIGMSRGLRRGSRGWRIWGLFVIWIGLVAVVYKAYLMIEPHLNVRPNQRLPELTSTALALLVGALILQLWQLRVLTHPDVVDFFRRKP
jgi:uncharacterized membrane protein HdeD (DUF308 family)